MKRKRRKVELGFATSDRVLPQTIELNKRDTTFSKVFSLHTFVDLLFCATIVLLIVEMKQQRLFGILYFVHRCTFCTLCTPVKIDVSLFPLLPKLDVWAPHSGVWRPHSLFTMFWSLDPLSGHLSTDHT